MKAQTILHLFGHVVSIVAISIFVHLWLHEKDMQERGELIINQTIDEAVGAAVSNSENEAGMVCAELVNMARTEERKKATEEVESLLNANQNLQRKFNHYKEIDRKNDQIHRGKIREARATIDILEAELRELKDKYEADQLEALRRANRK